MLTPNWAQLKAGPVLRGESDWRSYVGQFKPAPSEIAGLRRRWLLVTKPVTLESNHGNETPTDERIFCFQGTGEHFAPLIGYDAELKRRLQESVVPQVLARVQGCTEHAIGIHVRRGDFTKANATSDFRERGALRTPMEWFVGALRCVRRLAGSDLPAFVVSDGSVEEIAGLLSEPGVEVVRTGTAIGDLLHLSRAKLLIGSGGSSFSAWAAFLGRIPAVTIPGQSLSWFKLRHLTGEYIGDLDPANPPNELVVWVERVLAREASAVGATR